MRIFRFNRDADAHQQRAIRDVVQHSLQVLKNNPPPDTFLGRKTQEPFRQEAENEPCVPTTNGTKLTYVSSVPHGGNRRIVRAC